MLKLKMPFKFKSDTSYEVMISGMKFEVIFDRRFSRYDFKRRDNGELVEQFLVFTNQTERGTYWIRHANKDYNNKTCIYEFYMTADDISGLGGLQKTFEHMMREDA